MEITDSQSIVTQERLTFGNNKIQTPQGSGPSNLPKMSIKNRNKYQQNQEMYMQESNKFSMSGLNKAYESESHLQIAQTQQTLKSKTYFNKKTSKVAPEILPDENFEDDNGSCVEVEQSFVLKSTKKTISNNHQRIVPFHMPVNQTFKKDKKQINSSEIYITPGSIL